MAKTKTLPASYDPDNMIFNTPIWWQARIIFGNLCRLSAKRQNLQRTLIILLKLHESQSWMSQDMNLGI